MEPSKDEQKVPQFQMRWLDMMHIRVASLKHRLKPPVEYASTIDEYDLSDVALEETLAKSSGTCELLYLVRGQMISTIGPTGRAMDRVIVSQTEVPLSGTAYYDEHVAGCRGTTVPAWRCRDVFDLTGENLVTVIASQIRPAVYGYVGKPRLTPPSAARQKQSIVDSCFELRRGDFVRTVDGIERQIVSNDCQLMVLFDTSVVAFTYYKVKEVKTRPNRAVTSGDLAWWGRQTHICEPVHESKASCDLLQDNWNRSGRTSSAQFPDVPLTLPAPTTASNDFPPLRHHGRPREYARPAKLGTGTTRSGGPKSDTSAKSPKPHLRTTQADDAATTPTRKPVDGSGNGGGGGNGDNGGGNGDGGSPGDKQSGDDDDGDDSDEDEDEEETESDDEEEKAGGGEKKAGDEEEEVDDGEEEVDDGEEEVDDGEEKEGGGLQKVPNTKKKADQGEAPLQSPTFSSPLKRRKGPLISLPLSSASASPPLMSFPDDGTQHLSTPLQPATAPSDRRTPPPVARAPPVQPTSQPCRCNCSASSVSDTAAKRISQQISNMGTNMQRHFDETYGPLLRRIASVHDSNQHVATQTDNKMEPKAVQATAKQKTSAAQTTVSGNIGISSKETAAGKEIAAVSTADSTGGRKRPPKVAPASESVAKRPKGDGEKPKKGAGKKQTGASGSGGRAAAPPLQTPIIQLRLPVLKYCVISQPTLGVRRWGGSLPVEYHFDDDYVVLRERHVETASAAAGEPPTDGAGEGEWARHCKKFSSSMIGALCEHDGTAPAVFFPKPDSRKVDNMEDLIDRQPAPLGVILQKYVSAFADGGGRAALGGMRMYVDGHRLLFEESLKDLEARVKPKTLLDYWRK